MSSAPTTAASKPSPRPGTSETWPPTHLPEVCRRMSWRIFRMKAGFLSQSASKNVRGTLIVCPPHPCLAEASGKYVTIAMMCPPPLYPSSIRVHSYSLSNGVRVTCGESRQVKARVRRRSWLRRRVVRFLARPDCECRQARHASQSCKPWIGTPQEPQKTEESERTKIASLIRVDAFPERRRLERKQDQEGRQG